MSEQPERLYRFGTDWESAERLERLCENAVAADYPHGVSAVAQHHHPAASMAVVPELELYFEVQQTGRNRMHYTVVLPHPVTDEAADTFNRIFGRLEEAGGK